MSPDFILCYLCTFGNCRFSLRRWTLSVCRLLVEFYKITCRNTVGKNVENSGNIVRKLFLFGIWYFFNCVVFVFLRKFLPSIDIRWWAFACYSLEEHQLGFPPFICALPLPPPSPFSSCCCFVFVVVLYWSSMARNWSPVPQVKSELWVGSRALDRTCCTDTIDFPSAHVCSDLLKWSHLYEVKPSISSCLGDFYNSSCK